MRKSTLLVILIVLGGLLLAEVDTFSFEPQMTIETFSQENGIPSKKIKEYLNIPMNTDILTTFAELEITKQQAVKTYQKFQKKKNSYMFGITLVGMIIVFASLILIGFIINQLSHLQKEKKSSKKRKKRKNKPNFSVSTQQDEPSSDAIIAAITTVYLHELEVEEQNNLLLTWRRANVSMWKAVNKVNVPNRNFFKAQRSER
jgi:Na+-transporting methylmalonyl-CoA/oxaloacetate decarboxylase gamma subunit